MRHFLIIIISFNIILAECNYDIGDLNNDNLIDIIDIVSIINYIAESYSNEYISIYDVNSDFIINIVDVVFLVQRIFYNPISINFVDIEYDFTDIVLSWDLSVDYAFLKYNIYYSDILNDEDILIYSTDSINDTMIVISNLSLKEQNWFTLSVEDSFGCETFSDQYLYELPYFNYSVDSLGNIINTPFDVNHFNSAQDCQGCHPTHYDEWSQSMHAYTAHSPLFFSYKNQTVNSHPDVGDKFCVQCHNPVAFLTNTDLSNYQTVDQFQNSDLSNVIKEGISCDVCHTVTGISETVRTPNNGAANALYKLYPGENIKFGPISNPESNGFHNSFYLPTYEVSEQCLPCHDLVVRNIEAEVTFTEWNRIPGFAMFGGIPCQSCHMPEKDDGTHDHTFIGVDMDLAIPYLENPLFSKVSDMLSDAVTMEFEFWGQQVPGSISNLDTLVIPITIESLTAHSIPSGTSFNREAWLELLVKNNDTIIFSSGYINSNSQTLDYGDENLLLFTSYLINDQGDTTNSVIDTHDIINNSLPAYSQRFKSYEFIIPEEIQGSILLTARLLFRPFIPEFINEHHPEFIDNLPVFEMYSISQSIIIE